jgi:hypothetical protein
MNLQKQRSSKMKEGTFVAKAVDHAISETRAGDPQVCVAFQFETDEGTQNLTWYGSLKEKALPYTADALIALGFLGTDLSLLSDSFNGNLLPNEVKIVVANERVLDGNVYPRVKWINNLSSSKFRGVLSRPDAVKKLAGINFQGVLAEKQQKIGAKKPEEQIPF